MKFQTLVLLSAATILVGCTPSNTNPGTKSSTQPSVQPGSVMTMPDGSLMTMVPGNEATPSDVTDLFTTYAEIAFAGSDQWLKEVTKVILINGVQKVTVTTRAHAGPICAALSNFEVATTNRFTGVQVLDPTGAVIINRPTEVQECS